MPTGGELLNQAYALAESGKADSAIKVLERIIRLEPQRVEAWEFYLQLCTSKYQLNELAERISSNSKIDPDDKDDVLRYYRFLLQGNKGIQPEHHEEKKHPFYWYIIPAIFILLLIILGARKIDQVLGLPQYLSGIILFIVALFGSLYFLRVMYLQSGGAKRQVSRRYAKTVDHLRLKPELKRPRKK